MKFKQECIYYLYVSAYQTDNTKYTHVKRWQIEGISTTANSEYAYMMIAERPRYVGKVR
jgi:hypothetical protein